MSTLGGNFAENANRQIQGFADQDTLDSILKRSQNTNANIDDLLFQVMNIHDPTRRAAGTNILQNRQKRNQENQKLVTEKTEVNRVLNSDDPLRELNKSNLPLDTKVKLGKHINEQMLLGGISNKQPIQNQQNNIAENVGSPLEEPQSSPEEIEQESIETGIVRTTPEQVKEAIAVTQPINNPALSRPSYILADGSMDLTQASASELPKLAQIYPKAVDAENKRRDRLQKSFIDRRKFASERALPFMKEMDDLQNSLLVQEDAGNLMMSASKGGNLGFFSRDSLAQMVPDRFKGAFRTGEGQLFITAGKEWLIGDIPKAGPRPNMWIEQQISGALPTIGTSKESQQIAAIAKLANTSVGREKVRIANQVADEEFRLNGFYPHNISNIVNEKLKPVAQGIQDRLSYDIGVLVEQEKGIDKLREEVRTGKKGVSGQYLTMQRLNVLREKFGDDVDKIANWSERHGYKLPSPAQYQKWIKTNG